MKKQLSPNKIDNKRSTMLVSIISKLQNKKKRYCFQLLKQFILFPDDSDSSQKTVSKYDSLIFSDELIHTMFKKIQTKLIECKIWAFLNLKYFRCLQAAKKMEKPIKVISNRIQKENKIFSFISIKTHSEINMNKQKIFVSTQTQVEKSSNISVNKQRVASPRKTQRTPTKVQINVDIHHEFQINTPKLISNQSKQSSKGKVNVYYYQPTIQSQPQLAYPLSQLHPSHIKQSLAPTQNSETPIMRQHRLITSNKGLDNRQRSRSNSTIRYQYDVNGSRRIIVNGKQVPLHQKLQRNQNSLKKEQQRCQIGGSRRVEEQKRQNLKYEYQNNHNNYESKLRSPRNYNQNANEREQLKPYCHNCGQNHSNNLICSQKRSQKVIRLRSNSKRDQNAGYLQHLNS